MQYLQAVIAGHVVAPWQCDPGRLRASSGSQYADSKHLEADFSRLAQRVVNDPDF